MSQRDRTVASFVDAVSQLVSHYRELSLAIHNKRNEASLGNELATQTTLSLVVHWENFISDILLVYAQRDPTRLIRSTQSRVLQSVEQRFGKACSRHLRLVFPRTLSPKTIAAIADGSGRNITAASAADLAARANDLLSGRFAKRFTLEPRDYQFYDYIIAVRNYLGHFSRMVLKALREAIQKADHPANLPFSSQFTQIGPYLRGKAQPEQKSRVELIGERLTELAKKL